MKRLKPNCFEDVVAGISLFRPGPMDSIPKYIENKKNPDKIQYVTPKVAEILDVSYGCLVYQEQVMQIVRDLAGYSYGRSDLVRRAMSKKKADVMMEEKEWFINGKLAEDGSVEIPGCIRMVYQRKLQRPSLMTWFHLLSTPSTNLMQRLMQCLPLRLPTSRGIILLSSWRP